MIDELARLRIERAVEVKNDFLSKLRARRRNNGFLVAALGVVMFSMLIAFFACIASQAVRFSWSDRVGWETTAIVAGMLAFTFISWRITGSCGLQMDSMIAYVHQNREEDFKRAFETTVCIWRFSFFSDLIGALRDLRGE